jgi:methyl-accepting chemotaxis protein
MFRKLAGLSTRTKLTAILVSLLVPISMLFWFVLQDSLATMRTARNEDGGVHWVIQLVDTARNLVEHRDHAVAVAAGRAEEKAEMQEHAERVHTAVKELDTLHAEDFGGLAKVVEWNSLREEVLAPVAEDVPANDIVALHNAAGDRLLVAIDRAAIASGLKLDPEADSFALMDAAVLQMPVGLQALAVARRKFDELRDGDTRPATRLQLGEQLGIAATRLGVALEDITTDYAGATAEAEEKLLQSANAARGILQQILPKMKAVGAGGEISVADAAALSEQIELLTEQLASVQDDSMSALNGILDMRLAHERATMIRHVVTVMLSLLLAIAIAFGVTRYLSSQVAKANGVFVNIAQGRFDTVIGAQAGDELGVLLTSLDRMQNDLRARLDAERERAEAERQVAMENARIRQALDATTSNVMVADEGNNIIYLNRTAQSLMSASQAEFRTTVPQFDAAKLLGTNIDVFHKNPAHQRGLLSGLSKTFTSELKIGNLTMRIIASPIFDDAGKRLGTVVEWTNRTQELATEAEVQSIVAETLKGNLDRRISLDGKEGFFRNLSTGMNELVENVAGVVGEVQALVSAVNAGDLDKRIQTEGKSGLTSRIGSGINELTANIETVVEQVQELVAAANSGDLAKRIQTEGKSGLLVKVGSGINQLTDNMAGIVSQVKSAAEEVSKGADEISQGNANLSQRTEEQASSLEETASSMEEMTSTVKQNADNAGQANQLAVAARDQAEKGGAVVSKAVKAMTEINDSSRKIADIIGVIDEIAFQTNLLALNAAVEAARAGEQGRGFAVVATEVRNLAGRSATAAKEIKALIQDSVQKVQDGSNLVTQSGATLEQIVAAVKKVTDIVAEIAAASHEQSSGIEQVNKAVMQLDELTQQNAALVEEASASSQSMAEQARTLNELMRRYQIDGQPAATERAAAAPRAERRASTRPWNPARKPASASTSARTPDEPRAAAAANGDAAWKEF